MESVVSVLNEIRQKVELLESSPPTRIDPMAVSPISKLPYKALLYREALIWRMAELSREALESFEKNKLVSAIVLTRAAIETSAALWYLCAKVKAVVESSVVGDIDNYLMQLMMGTATGASTTDSNATDPVLPRPIKVGAFLRQVDKDIEGFSHHYGILSEYAHPKGGNSTCLFQAQPGRQMYDIRPKYPRRQYEEHGGSQPERGANDIREKLHPHRRPHANIYCTL